QNDARAHDCTRPSQLFASRTEKARNLTVSQRLTPGTCRPRRLPCFPAAAPIWGDNSGDSRVKSSNPHTFLCTPCGRSPHRTILALLPTIFVMAGLDPAIHVFGEGSPGLAALARGFRSSNLRLLELNL